jgi:predicted kinase
VRIVLVTGAPGAGKSTIATLVHDHLGDAGVANALVEADELRRAYPEPDAGDVRRRLAGLVASYADAGHDLVLVTETLETADDLAGLRAALPEAEILLVRLDADPETARARVRAREPAGWSGLPQLLESAGRLAVTMRGLRADLVVRNEDADPEVAAAAVLAALRPGAGPTPRA